jgi:hypothetical protein
MVLRPSSHSCCRLGGGSRRWLLLCAQRQNLTEQASDRVLVTLNEPRDRRVIGPAPHQEGACTVLGPIEKCCGSLRDHRIAVRWVGWHRHEVGPDRLVVALVERAAQTVVELQAAPGSAYRRTVAAWPSAAETAPAGSDRALPSTSVRARGEPRRSPACRTSPAAARGPRRSERD